MTEKDRSRDATQPVPLRQDVVVKIRKLIRESALKSGDRLPSERDLAQRFSVSRPTVREAIHLLEALGLVEIRDRGGTFIRVKGTRSDARNEWLQWVERHRGQILETLELRLGCEAFAAELAARRAGPLELAQLVDALRAMKAAGLVNDAAAFVQSDIDFHDALLQATGNKTLHKMVSALGRDLIPERAAILDVSGRMERSMAEHSAIYTAVQAGDSAAAALAMRRHLESVKHDVMVHLVGADAPAAPTASEPANKRRRALPSGDEGDHER